MINIANNAFGDALPDDDLNREQYIERRGDVEIREISQLGNNYFGWSARQAIEFGMPLEQYIRNQRSLAEYTYKAMQKVQSGEIQLDAMAEQIKENANLCLAAEEAVKGDMSIEEFIASISEMALDAYRYAPVLAAMSVMVSQNDMSALYDQWPTPPGEIISVHITENGWKAWSIIRKPNEL